MTEKSNKVLINEVKGYKACAKGLYRGTDDDLKRICSPIRATGRSVNFDGGDLAPAIVVQIKSWNKIVQLEIPDSMFLYPSKVAELLMAKGLQIEQSADRRLICEYLQNSCGDKYYVRSAQEGWIKFPEGAQVYIIGNRAIAANHDTWSAILQSGVQSRFSSIGTEKGWQEIAGLCGGNPILITSLCMAFSSALLDPIGHDSCFFMLVGRSGTGKSTILKMCVSLCTNPDGLMTWGGTANGIEAAVLQNKDMPTVLDEIGQSNVDALKTLIYQLANTSGKLRANSNGELVDLRRTRTAILCAGEESAVDRLNDAGKAPRLGEFARMIAIPANELFGAFSNLHGSHSGAEFSELINQKIRSNYGYPWPKFIEHLAEVQEDIRNNFDKLAGKIREALVAEIVDAPEGDGVFERVLGKFVLMVFAGFEAHDAQVVPWKRTEIIKSVGYCFNLWYAEYSKYIANPDDGILQELRYLLQSARNKLPPLSAYNDSDRHTDVGFIYQPRGESETLILVFPGFLRKRFGKSHSNTALGEVLRRSGYLEAGSRDVPTKQIRIPGTAMRVSFYALRQSILGD